MAPERLCKLMDVLSCNCADGVTGPACPDGLPSSSRRSSCLGDEEGYLALGCIDQAAARYWVPSQGTWTTAHQSKTCVRSWPSTTHCLRAGELGQSRGWRRIHELYFISLEHAAFY